MTDKLNKSPAHFEAYVNGEDTPRTDAMKFGSAYHAWVLEGDTFWDHYAMKPEGLKKPTEAQLKAKKPAEKTVNQIEEWNKFTASIQGKEVIKAEDLEKLRNMRQVLEADPYASKLLFINTKYTEIAMFWKDPLTNVSCKAKADLIRNNGVMVDLKTTEDASPEGFMRSVAKYRYHVQAASYSGGYRQITGEHSRGFIFVAQEKSPPYVVSCYQLPEHWMLDGEVAYNKNLDTYVECMNTQKWPGYNDGIVMLEPKPWMLAED